MKWFRYFLKGAGAILALLLVFAGAAVTRLDHTPYRDTGFFREWKSGLQAITFADDSADTILKAGWARFNITPDAPGPMAGYGKRKGMPYRTVHDSVFVNAIVLQKGEARAAIISADLLIIPPTVIKKLKGLLSGEDIPYEHLYFGATHTHNSVGGWGKGISGLFFSGPYDPAVEDHLAEAILKALRAAGRSLGAVRMSYQEAVDTKDINNRLIGKEGDIDPEVRSLRLVKDDGQQAVLVTYAAHSTVLNSGTMALSRDWPGVLTDSLERDPGTFAVYMAGAVGSMSPNEVGRDDFDELVQQATGVLHALNGPDVLSEAAGAAVLRSVTLPLPLGDPAPRLKGDWALRSWIFRKLFGDYPVEIKALRLGNVLLIGVPCDFSGELMADIDQYAAEKGMHLMVTSFNGGYTGYVTHDRWYDLDTYETVTMSWYGPHKGEYFQEVVRDLTDAMK